MTRHFDYERCAFMLPADIARRLDNASDDQNVSRGTWVLEAIKEKLARHEDQPREALRARQAVA